jgi:predicted nucleic acid-binding protein
MPTAYLLDTGPLGLLAHNKLIHSLPIESWLISEIAAGATVYLSEVADYEVRRELVRLIQAGRLPLTHLNRLNQLPTLFPYLSVTTAMWQRAAEFWADARTRGLPTASPAALDGDVLIAAQAAEIQATVVTTNAAHIGVWVRVKSLAINGCS